MSISRAGLDLGHPPSVPGAAWVFGQTCIRWDAWENKLFRPCKPCYKIFILWDVLIAIPDCKRIPDEHQTTVMRGASFGAAAMALACLHSASADTIQEKRLRADYCLGFFLAQKNYFPKLCAGVTTQICQQAVARNQTMLQRLIMYLSSTGGMGDTSAAMVQGKLDADQCFRILDDPQNFACDVACYQKRVARQTPAEAVRTAEETLRYCQYECHPICAKVFDCSNYDPW
jgi:hypothetical protein